MWNRSSTALQKPREDTTNVLRIALTPPRSLPLAWAVRLPSRSSRSAQDSGSTPAWRPCHRDQYIFLPYPSRSPVVLQRGRTAHRRTWSGTYGQTPRRLGGASPPRSAAAQLMAERLCVIIGLTCR